MATQIIEATNRNLTDEQILSTTSRYVNSTPIYYGELRKLTMKIYKKKTPKTSEDDNFMVVKAGREYRPDLVSNEFYGTPDFWWKILEYNNIKDIFDFKAGINIVLPANVLF